MDNSGTMRSEGVGVETLVLVLTDVQGSTRLWQDEPVAMDAAMRRHHEIVHGAVAEHGGWRPVDQGEGDAVFAAFGSPSEALTAVIQIQRALAAESWPTTVPLTVRLGVHVGEVTERNGNLYGDPVNRCARLRGLGAGGQTLLSAPVYELVRDKLPPGTSVTDLGQHRMKDLTRPEHVWQLDLDGLPSAFPALSSLDRVRHNLPIQTTPFIGREAELDQLVAALREHRLVTLTGFGGMGKTRTALQAAAELVGTSVADEVFFVDLAAVTEAAAVPARVAEATGTRYDDDPVASLVAAYQSSSTLLVLDNLEQVLGCAPFVADLLARTTGLRVLATSREALRVRAERVVQLRPMAVPTQGGDPAALDTFEAVRLFLDRARAVKPEFQVTNDNAPAIAAVCDRLDGHPLALELAASRLRMMSVDALRTRLDSALKVLTGGGRDMPERHQTLRATIAWSYDGLDEDERLLLARMSCLPGSADFELVEAACGEDLDVFSSLEVLVDRSLVRTSEGELGETRYGLLVSIRDYAHEQLEAGDREAVGTRHAAHILALAETAKLHPAGFEDVAFVRRELTHVRAALTHLLTTDDHTGYARLVVAVLQGLSKNALDREAVQHAERALTFDNPLGRRAELLGSLAFVRGDADTERQASEAARAAGDDELLAGMLIQSLPSRGSVAEVMATLDELEAMWSTSVAVRNVAIEREEAVNILGSALRYGDPAEAADRLSQLLHSGPSTHAFGPFRVRLARILLDHGLLDDAAEALGASESAEDFNGIIGWLHFGRAERGRLLSARGDLARGAALAWPALEACAAAGGIVHYIAIAAVTCSTALDLHDDVVRGVDLALTVPANAAFEAALTWRRAHARLALGDPDRCRRELEGSRTVLAQSELRGPRELLGCLVTEALLVHESDPARAARILGSVEGHRTTTLGRWALPHRTDRDAERLTALLLPTHRAAYDEGLALTPQDLVRSAPL